jgi:hypothetical protein
VTRPTETTISSRTPIKVAGDFSPWNGKPPRQGIPTDEELGKKRTAVPKDQHIKFPCEKTDFNPLWIFPSLLGIFAPYGTMFSSAAVPPHTSSAVCIMVEARLLSIVSMCDLMQFQNDHHLRHGGDVGEVRADVVVLWVSPLPLPTEQHAASVNFHQPFDLLLT